MNKEDNLCWYHGTLPRNKAEEILCAGGTEGLFLVRESESSLGDFVLSVFHQGEVSHYQIHRHGEDAFFSIEGGNRMHGLDTLVDHYRNTGEGLSGATLTEFVRDKVPPHDARQYGKTNLLHRATKESSLKVVSEMLKSGYSNIDAKNQEGQTAVHLACQIQQEAILQQLIEAGANLTGRDIRGDTPLHYACRNANEAMTRLLLEQHVNVQARNNTNGFVPLHEAAKCGNIQAVRLLLEERAPLLPRANDGQFPIDLAREFGHTEVVKYLEEYVPPRPQTFTYHWYHETQNRAFAENMLLDYANMMEKTNDGGEPDADDTSYQITDGLFLVRFSKGNYVLTMLFEKKALHFIIKQHSKYFYIDEGPFMSSLEHLIEHFKLFADGLPVNLRHAIKPGPKPPLPLFSTIPRRKKPENSVAPASPIAASTAASASTESPKKSGFFGRKSSEDIKSRGDIKISRNLSLPSEDLNAPTSGSSGNLITRISPNLKSFNFSKNKKKKKDESDEKKLLDDIQIEIPNMIKQLSFSTDFLSATMPQPPQFDPGEVYNVPTNNSAIDSWKPDNMEISMDYFMESDIAIQSKRNSSAVEEIYFVDKPASLNQYQNDAESSTGLQRNPAGYIVMQSVPMFVESQRMTGSESGANNNQCTEQQQDNRTTSYNRGESIVSYAESEFEPILQHQISSTSTSSAQSEAAATVVASRSNKKKCPNYFISMPELILGEAIGNGEFGNVVEGKLRRIDGNTGAEIDSPLPVAIKMLHDEHCRQNRDEFLREASVMIQLKHHCIVKLIGITRGPPLMMVQELMPLGSMHTFLCNNFDNISPNSELKLWASQIACGMQFLETQHFVHRDLAARNILLASMHQAKISDFGLSRALSKDNDYYKAQSGGKWPIKWYAPESFNYGTFSHASDVWSFGVTLWEMFSLGNAPYGELTGKEVIELIEQGHRLEKPELCPDNIFEMMENCWRYEPKNRPSFRHLIEFFASQPEYINLMEMIKTEHIG